MFCLFFCLIYRFFLLVCESHTLVFYNKLYTQNLDDNASNIERILNLIEVLRVPLLNVNFVYGVYLWCISTLPETSTEFFPIEQIEERSLIIDFIRSLGSLDPAIHTTPELFKNGPITGRFLFLFEETLAWREITFPASRGSFTGDR